MIKKVCGMSSMWEQVKGFTCDVLPLTDKMVFTRRIQRNIFCYPNVFIQTTFKNEN